MIGNVIVGVEFATVINRSIPEQTLMKKVQDPRKTLMATKWEPIFCEPGWRHVDEMESLSLENEDETKRGNKQHREEPKGRSEVDGEPYRIRLSEKQAAQVHSLQGRCDLA